jgi:hypothetical protein
MLWLMSNLLGVVGIALILQSAFSGYELAQSAMLTLLAGSCALAASLLLLGRRVVAGGNSAAGLRSDLAYAALAAASTLGFILVTGNADGRAVPLAVGCFVLVWLVGTGTAVVERLGAAASLAASLIAALVMLTSAAPLWLAPLSELSGSSTVVNLVLAISPLTLLAVLADFDFLRTGWFYQHSVIGALRYEYPSGWALIANYALLSIAYIMVKKRHIGAEGAAISRTKA